MNTDPTSIRSRLDKVLVQLRYLPFAASLVWTAARNWTLAWVVLLLVQGILPVTIVYLTRSVVDTLVPLMGNVTAWAELTPIIWRVVLLAGAVVLAEGLRGVAGWVRTAQAELVQDHISGLVYDKASTLDLAFYEDPAYYDRLHRARVEAVNQPVSLLENLGQILQHTLTLVAMAGILLPFGWWIPLLLIGSTLPALGVVLRMTLRQHQWQIRTTADRRRTYYFGWILTLREAAAELRLFSTTTHFQQAYQSLRQRLRTERVQLAKEQAWAELGAGSLALIATGGVVIWMLWQAARGHVTFGDVVLLYQAFQQGQRLLRTLLSNVGQVYSNILFLENLVIFLHLEPQIVDPLRPISLPSHDAKPIQFDNVTFRYPGSERVALDQFSLTLPAGQIVALVGANGAGKSTVTKLLCRFYDPESGRVTLDGINLKDLSLTELRRQITILFQKPVQYHASASDNIRLGDLTQVAEESDIQAAAIAAGADVPIERLPKGYDTLLGKWFGSTDLSGGEWQRVALARAFWRQAPILVLDEPTSAMDSWAEAAWLSRFIELAAGRTVLIITHRFTTAMHADVIHVMEEGQIIESGSHPSLLAMGGRYAQSWTAQMQAHAEIKRDA